MLDTKALGERIRELRKAHGLTQNAFAEQMHVSFQAISNWERGIAPPELDNLMRIADFFKVLVDDLLHTKSGALYLGVDGGGTKTEFAVVTPDGTVLMHFRTDASNPNDRGILHTIEVVREGLRRARTAYPSLRAVFCGISGIATADYKQTLLKTLREEFPTLTFEATTDAFNLFSMNDEADMALISGTGSVVFVREKNGLRRLGGYGQLFDTAGSAYDIGRDAISLILKREDEQKPPTLLTKKLLEELGVDVAWDAVGALYREGKAKIASLARVVFDAARCGDADAICILEKSAEHLASLLNLGIQTYGARPVAIISGGLLEHYSDIFLPMVKKHTEAELILLDLPPVFGACRAACRICDERFDESFYENFKTSYRGIKNDSKN